MQRTFGETVGLEAVVPSRVHPDDLVVCSDGTKIRRGDAYLDCRDCPHGSEDERDEADLTIVEEILNLVDECVSDYCGEDGDWESGYEHIVQECSHDWPVAVKEWIQDNYDFSAEIDDKLTDKVCEELDGTYDWEAEFNHSEYACYSGDGCCLWGNRHWRV